VYFIPIFKNLDVYLSVSNNLANCGHMYTMDLDKIIENMSRGMEKCSRCIQLMEEHDLHPRISICLSCEPIKKTSIRSHDEPIKKTMDIVSV
jgi:hypothetical protein